ncbi:MAG TPA: tRNA lysidine(34) synthetase TilS [Planctomycetota bacterium]|nr:tRNA lysidine(34) synthetase TilS [Planctomycetota bacterium]
MKLLQLVKQSIERRGLIDRGDAVVVGVSGGADSVSLLCVLHELAASMELRLAVAHLNHGIRGEAADADEAFVRALAAELRLQFLAEKADVPGLVKAEGGSLEEVARRTRYAFLGRAAAIAGARKIALGHTADDNAETVLQRILRGTGFRGLGGIPPKRPLARKSTVIVVRPLIDAARSDVIDYLEAAGRTWRTDATNFDTSYSRNHVRLALLPYLESTCGPGVKESLNRLAHGARNHYNVIESIARELAAKARRTEAGALLSLDCGALGAANPEMQIEALRLSLEDAGVGQLSYEHCRRLLQMPGAATGCQMSLPGGFLLRAEYGLLRVIDPFAPPCASQAPSAVSDAVAQPRASQAHSAVPDDILLPLPGRAGYLDMTFTAELVENEHGLFERFLKGKSRDREMIDADRLRPPLTLRTRQPGDRFHPLGATGSRKLHDFFIDEKLPAWRRDRVPIVCDRDGIVWVAGCRIDERVRITAQTQRIALLTISSH